MLVKRRDGGEDTLLLFPEERVCNGLFRPSDEGVEAAIQEIEAGAIRVAISGTWERDGQSYPARLHFHRWVALDNRGAWLRVGLETDCGTDVPQWDSAAGGEGEEHVARV